MGAEHSSQSYIYYADSVLDSNHEEDTLEDVSEKSRGKQLDPSGHDKKDDWDLAVRFRDIQRYGYIQPKLKSEMSEKAIRSILNRSREILGPIQKPYRYFVANQSEAEFSNSVGSVVELDVEESLQAQELIFQVRTEKNHGLILLLDTSLSMKGEKLAFLAVTIAAVAASVPPSTLCILGFDSEIHPIKEFAALVSLEVLISRVLAIPPGGFTNIELGLDACKFRIRNGAYPQCRVVLISDGRYTEGKDPVLVAKTFSFIYPVKIGKDPTGRQIMKEISMNGRGRFSEVRDMKDLPRILLNSIRTWVK